MIKVKNFFLLFILYLLWTLLINLIKCNENNSNEINNIQRQDILDFINEIKENVDITVDPCDNFAKYSCGRMKNLEKSIPFPNIEIYIFRYFFEGEPTSKAEHIARPLLLYCEQFRKNREDFTILNRIYKELEFLNKLGTFPIQNVNLTNKNIAELEAEFVSITSRNFFLLNPDKNYTLTLSPGTFTIKTDDIKKIFNVLNNNSTTDPSNSKEIENIMIKVIDFTNKLNELKEQVYPWNSKTEIEVIKEINSLNELKDLLPSKNFDWEIFIDILEKNLNLKEQNDKNKYNNVKVLKLSFLKKYIELIDSTDIQTLINYAIYQFMYLTKYKCDPFMMTHLNRKILLKKIWTENLTNRTVERYTNFLNDFDILFKETIAEIPNNETDIMEDYFANKRNILENHTKIITEEDLEKIYNNYDPNKPHKSHNEFFKKEYKNLLNEIYSRNDFRQYLENYLDAIELNIKNKPLFYFYKIVQTGLWFKYFKKNNDKHNRDFVDKCLKNIGENSQYGTPYENVNFINYYAALKLTLTSLNSNDLLNNEIKIIKDIIAPEKLFFISMGQYFCRKGERKDEHTAQRTLRHLKEFSDAFSCSKGTNMNRYNDNVCDLGFCHSEFPYIKELIPYSIKGC